MTPRTSRRRSAGGTWLAGAVFLAAAVGAQSSMAAVFTAHVEYEVQHGPGLPFFAATKDSVVTFVEATVSERLSDQWKLVDWQPAPGEGLEPGEPGVRWVVTLAVEPQSVTDESGASFDGRNVFLRHRVEIGGTSVSLALNQDSETLYDYREALPGPGEANLLIERLRSRLEDQLTTLGDSFEFRQQMRGISLVDRVISDERNHRIIIPLKYDDLAADLDSRLRVELRGDALPNHMGRLDVKITGPVRDAGDDDGGLQGFVVGPVVDVVPLEADGEPVQLPRDWHQHFKNLIESAGSVSVNLLEYFPAPDAPSDGIEPVPDP